MPSSGLCRAADSHDLVYWLSLPSIGVSLLKRVLQLGPVWAELEDAVLSLQRRRVQRFKERQRKAHQPRGATPTRRRPAKTQGR